MNQLQRIFSQTIAPIANYGSDQNKAKEKEDSDPMLDAFVPQGDSVQLSSFSSGNRNSVGFNRAMQGQFGGLPSLSKTYSSQLGGTLDLRG